MKSILLVIDMQEGFLVGEDATCFERKVEDLLDKNLFDVVITTRFLNGGDSVYEHFFNWDGMMCESEQAVPAGIARHSDYCVNKYVYNCVNTNFIQKLIQLNNGEYPKKVYIVGLNTDCCVLTIATSLFEHNIRPIVLANYCYSCGGEEQHDAGLLCLQRLIGKQQISYANPVCKKDLEIL